MDRSNSTACILDLVVKSYWRWVMIEGLPSMDLFSMSGDFQDHLRFWRFQRIDNGPIASLRNPGIGLVRRFVFGVVLKEK